MKTKYATSGSVLMEVFLNGYDYFLIFFAFNVGMLYYCGKKCLKEDRL